MLHSLKLTAKVLKIGRPQKGTYYSNHWFSGGMLVSGGCLPCNTCDTFCVDPYALRMVIHPDETTKHDSFFMGQPMQVFVVSPLGHFLNSVKVDESFWSYELCWHVEGIFCTWFPLYSDYFFFQTLPPQFAWIFTVSPFLRARFQERSTCRVGWEALFLSHGINTSWYTPEN